MNMKPEKIEVSFTPIMAEKGLQGFATIRIDDWLELGSVGVFSRADGSGFRLTFPAKRLSSGTYKFYFRIRNSEIEEHIREAVEREIKKLGLFSVKTLDEE